MSDDPEGQQPDPQRRPGSPAPSGVDLAREALARAKAQAKANGHQPGTPSARRRGGGTGGFRRGGYSGPGPDDRDPQLVGSTIRDLVAARGWEQTSRAATVLACWDRIVGAELAGHCRPDSVVDGELVLVAETTAWATQLRLLAGTLVARVQAELGPGVVTRVRVQGPTVPGWRHGPRRVNGRGPRDTYG